MSVPDLNPKGIVISSTLGVLRAANDFFRALRIERQHLFNPSTLETFLARKPNLAVIILDLNDSLDQVSSYQMILEEHAPSLTVLWVTTCEVKLADILSTWEMHDRQFMIVYPTEEKVLKALEQLLGTPPTRVKGDQP